MFPDASGPMVVHRLDMETSGLMVLGLNVESQRNLSKQFEHRRVKKAYHAIVRGQVCGEEGRIDFPIRADVTNRPYQIHDEIQGRPSVTCWRVLRREADRTLVRFEPITGRTHQIRLHSAHPMGLGCPIVGDSLYGSEPVEEDARLLLHASELAFDDPQTNERLAFVSQAPFYRDFPRAT